MRGSRQLASAMASVVCCGMLLGWSPSAWPQGGNDANGKKLFMTYCFLCHGKEGKGDGYAARFQPVRPRDLSDDAYMSSRTDEQIYRGISGGGPAFHGSMVMPGWWESLQEEQIWDLVAYVRTLHRKPPFQGVAARGTRIFLQYCWTCHGTAGKGDGPIAQAYSPRPRDLSDQAYVSSRTDYDLYNVISQGGEAVKRSATMPAWGQVLSPQEIWDLVAYIRELGGQP